MKTKTAYRPKSESPAENIPADKPAVEAVIAPSPEAPTVGVDVRPDTEATKADAAAEALKRQVEELARSEAFLRQQAQPQPPRPMTREEKLAVWQQQGMPGDQLEFLKANPELVDYSDLAAFAANEAAQAGHERGSNEHMHATKELFDKHLAHLQAQAQQQTEPAMKTTPDFFQPPLPKAPRASTSHWSAPVSREAPDSRRPEIETDPRRVTLSVDERLIAKSCNLSDTEFARQKLKMLRMKASGEIQ
jgi:hypothetical protein